MDIATLVEIKRNPKISDIAPGDTVKVSARIVEGGKERIQVFQGVVIKIKHGGTGANFTVRHVAFGIGVERTFPFYSSLVEKVEIVRQFDPAVNLVYGGFYRVCGDCDRRVGTDP